MARIIRTNSVVKCCEEYFSWHALGHLVANWASFDDEIKFMKWQWNLICATSQFESICASAVTVVVWAVFIHLHNCTNSCILWGEQRITSGQLC